MNQLKEILEQKGISQAFIARKLLVTRATVNLWANKKSNPRKIYLEKLSEILGVKKEEIFFGLSVNHNANVDNNKNLNLQSIDELVDIGLKDK